MWTTTAFIKTFSMVRNSQSNEKWAKIYEKETNTGPGTQGTGNFSSQFWPESAEDRSWTQTRYRFGWDNDDETLLKHLSRSLRMTAPTTEKFIFIKAMFENNPFVQQRLPFCVIDTNRREESLALQQGTETHQYSDEDFQEFCPWRVFGGPVMCAALSLVCGHHNDGRKVTR